VLDLLTRFMEELFTVMTIISSAEMRLLAMLFESHLVNDACEVHCVVVGHAKRRSSAASASMDCSGHGSAHQGNFTSPCGNYPHSALSHQGYAQGGPRDPSQLRSVNCSLLFEAKAAKGWNLISFRRSSAAKQMLTHLPNFC
jgi:hypothetical protein